MESGAKWRRSLRRGIPSIVALVSLLLLLSCSHTPDPAPSWSFDTGAIRITLTADKHLNRFSEKPHTLLLTIHQMSDPNAFKKLTQYETGLRKLLEGRSVDSTFTAVQRIYIEPGESKMVVLDRTESTKWVGVAAGYYSLDAEKVTKVFEIPYVVESKGFISKKRVATIPPLRLDLILGPESIQERKTP